MLSGGKEREAVGAVSPRHPAPAAAAHAPRGFRSGGGIVPLQPMSGVGWGRWGGAVEAGDQWMRAVPMRFGTREIAAM